MEAGVFTKGLRCEGWSFRLVEWFRLSWIFEWMIPNRCSRRGTWQLRVSECGCRRGAWKLQVSERDLKSRGKARGFLFGRAMSQLVCRVYYSLETLLMQWTRVTILTRVIIWPLQISFQICSGNQSLCVCMCKRHSREIDSAPSLKEICRTLSSSFHLSLYVQARACISFLQWSAAKSHLVDIIKKINIYREQRN